VVAVAPLKAWAPTAVLATVPWPRNERAPTAGLKTTSYADNVVALAWAHERGAAEALFLNTVGHVCEGTGSNVFYEVGGALVTPPLSSGCLGGITRELLLEWMAEEGTPVREDDHGVTELRAAREVFITSSTRAVQPVRALDGRAYAEAPGPLTRHAAEVFARRAAEHPDP
jgi:branched-chain amino acid aminotransferase